MNIRELLPMISAIIGMPAGRKNIVEVAYSYFEYSYTRKEIEAVFDELRAKKVFSAPPFVIAKKLMEPLVDQAIGDGIYSALASLILEQDTLFYYTQQYYHQDQLPLRGQSEYLALIRLSFLSRNWKRLLSVVYSNESRHLEAKSKLAGKILKELKPYLGSIALEKIPSLVCSWILEEETAAFALYGEDILIAIPDPDAQCAKDYLAWAVMARSGEEIEMGIEEMKRSPAPVYQELGHQVENYFKGDFEAAINSFEKAQKLLKKDEANYELGVGDGIYSILYAFSLIHCQGSKNGEKAEKFLNKLLRQRNYPSAYRPIYYLLLRLIDSKPDTSSYAFNIDFRDYSSPFIHLIDALYLRINDPESLSSKEFVEEYAAGLKQCADQEADWLLYELLAFEPKVIDEIGKEKLFFSMPQLASVIKTQGAWEKTLHLLEELVLGDEKKENRDRRLIWMIAVEESSYSGELEGEFAAKLQLKNKKGEWSAGKRMSTKQLKEYALKEECSELDRKIISLLKEDYYYSRDVFDIPECFPLLASHPYLYHFDELHGVKPELESLELQVIYKKEGKNLILTLGPESIDFSNARAIYWQKINSHRYAFTMVSEEAKKLVQLIGAKGLRVPESEADRIQKIVTGLTKLAPLHTDQVAQGVEERASDAKIHLYASFVNQMLELSLWIKPFADGEQLCRPGIGFSRMMASGNRYQAVRDFDLEKKFLYQVKACLANYLPLTEDGEEGAQFDYYCADLEMALELLTALKELESKEVAVVYWPKGESLRVGATPIDYSHLKLKMNKKNEWFEVEGEIDYPSESSLELVELIKSAKNSSFKQYIKLDDQTYLKIDRELKRHLELLDNGDGQESFKMKLDRTALLAHKQFLEKLQIKNKEVSSFYQLVEEVYGEHYLPSNTFKAELRDYQLTGFNWLKRLSLLGFGACLADDMGLGKTVQTISLLLDRSTEGPSLVIAPVSVLMNWRDEIQRFAPTLNPIFFSDASPKKRKKDQCSYAPRDVVVISYGLLQREEWLHKIDWNVVVLDEAQAIKNFQTKRAQACFDLKAKFKMVTTGTPIENNLSELWSLFHFLNPGLLGSFSAFSKTYMGGSSTLGMSSKSSVNILKKMIAPYILRRKKSEVLTELPEKTEITLRASLSPVERDFYESLRVKAIEDIETEQNPGKRLIKMLTELTRLRQAACHPALLNSELQFPSSKLELFWSVLEEILESGHKVLVFSQFVKFLKIIEKEFASKKISYLYLDGKTSQKRREEMVNKFQEGIGEVFLISLKAGGVGLNLTAADYVIHLDPWWNPAVENQATDRAHRIGQTRPVTVYKIVTEGTVEEKVMALHGQKLELAKGILEGSEVPTKLDPKFIFELLRR